MAWGVSRGEKVRNKKRMEEKEEYDGSLYL